MKPLISLALLAAAAATSAATSAATAPGAAQAQGQGPRLAERVEKPNIVLIYADDLGFGDLSCQGARGLKTPRMDALAAGGLRFTDGHAASSTCTPSRYSLLTGEYAFRQKGTGILTGDAPLIIEPGRATLPSLLQRGGYRTGIVGKWHLGLGRGSVDWNGEVKPGPLEVGFNESFIMAATGDRVPCVYVQNHRVVGLDPADPIRVSYGAKVGDEPTGRENPELLKLKPSHGHDQTIVNGISRIGYMSGGQAARWKDEEMSDTFARQARRFIEQSHAQSHAQNGGQNRGRPFFLFFAAHEPHVPRAPHPRFVGKSTMGPRGDAIAQLDSSVGEVLDTLDRLKIADNTLVILTSDNGAVVNDGYFDDSIKKLGGHKPGGPWRGGKYSNFEGGTRVPFLVRWPARVRPGLSSALVCQVDLLASLATLTGQPVPASAADSFDLLPALLGQDKRGREYLVEDASRRSLREGQWKYIPPSNGPRVQQTTQVETGNDPAAQLYDLEADPSEARNLAARFPERLQKMAARLEQIIAGGRSRPALEQAR